MTSIQSVNNVKINNIKNTVKNTAVKTAKNIETRPSSGQVTFGCFQALAASRLYKPKEAVAVIKNGLTTITKDAQGKVLNRTRGNISIDYVYDESECYKLKEKVFKKLNNPYDLPFAKVIVDAQKNKLQRVNCIADSNSSASIIDYDLVTRLPKSETIMFEDGINPAKITKFRPGTRIPEEIEYYKLGVRHKLTHVITCNEAGKPVKCMQLSGGKWESV